MCIHSRHFSKQDPLMLSLSFIPSYLQIILPLGWFTERSLFSETSLQFALRGSPFSNVRFWRSNSSSRQNFVHDKRISTRNRSENFVHDKRIRTRNRSEPCLWTAGYIQLNQVCMKYSGHQSCLRVHTGYFVINPSPSSSRSLRVILAFPYRVPF